MSYYKDISSQGSNMIDSLMSTARRRPEALLLLAAGAALMMTKGTARKTLHNAAQSVVATSRDARDYVDDLAEQARAAIDPVRDYASRATEYVSEASSNVLSQASDMAEETRRVASSYLDYYLHEQPIALGIFSLALGAAIGAALPATDVENRTLGAQSDYVVGKAREAAKEQIDQLKAAAGDLSDKVASGVKQQAETSSSYNERASS